MPPKSEPKADPKKAPKPVKAEPKKAPAKKAESDREVVYKEVVCALHDYDPKNTNGPIDVDCAKHLLGWEEEPEGQNWKDAYGLIDRDGKRVRLTNNTRNRPLAMGVADTYAQEYLRGRWKLNGETFVIGKTGLVISGQHRLVALVLAEQDRTGEDKDHWSKFVKGPVSIPGIVVFGVDEDDATVNTIDTGRPRSLADVLYRSKLFARLKPADRREAASILDCAVRLMWERTGAKEDAWAPRRTHAESLDFIERHKKLIDCVSHIRTENQEDANAPKLGKSIGSIIRPGLAAAMCYMMGAGKTDPAKYRKTQVERHLDFALMEKAEAFWMMIGSRQDKGGFDRLRHAIGKLYDGNGGGSNAEKLALLCLAWRRFQAGLPITDDSLNLVYGPDEGDGKKRLIETPTVGGIDLGKAKEEVEDHGAAAAEDGAEATAEIEDEAGPSDDELAEDEQ